MRADERERRRGRGDGAAEGWVADGRCKLREIVASFAGGIMGWERRGDADSLSLPKRG